MSFCSRCGAKLNEGDPFCPGCGAPVSGESHPELPDAPQFEYPVQSSRIPAGRKPLFKRWWFWVLVLVIVGGVFGRSGVQRTPSAAPGRTESNTIEIPTNTDTSSQDPGHTARPDPAPEKDPPPAAENEIRPEVKEFLDAYEACMDEYVAFMQKYAKASTDEMVAMMGDYYSVLNEYTEYAEKMDALDESELTNAELAYYIEVTNRVSQKLLKAAEG